MIFNNLAENIWAGGNSGVSFSPTHQIQNQFGGFGNFRVFNNRFRKFLIRSSAASNPAGGFVTPIFINSNSPDIHVYNNVVDSMEVSNTLTTFSTTGEIRGVIINGGLTGTFNIYNNHFGDFFTPHTNSTNNMFGVLVNTTSSPSVVNIYNNTIRFGRTGILTGTANTSAFGGAGIFFNAGANATSGAVNIKNNIIDINATPGTSANWACVKRSFGTAGVKPINFLSTSSNNTYRINTGMGNYYYSEGTGSAVTNGFTEWTANAPFTNDALFDGPCSAYKGFMQGEAFTISNNETWVAGPVANTFRPSGTTLSKSSAEPIVFITTDLNGGGRGATPDRGALQFTGTGSDVFAPTISYLDVPNLFCTTGASLRADITDNAGINTTSGTRPRLYFKKSTETNTFAAANTSAGNGWKWVEASNTSSPFIFNFNYSLLNSAVASGDVIQYFIIAQDNAGTANVSVQGASLTGGCPASVNIAGTAAITGATVPKSFAVNSSPPAYTIEHTPVTSCQGDTLTLRVILDSSTAVMRNYSSLVAPTNSTQTTQYMDIDTFQFGLGLNASACAGLTPAAGPAANGLPVSVTNRYSNYTSSAFTSLTDLIAGTNVNFNMTVSQFNNPATNWGSAFAIFIDYNRNGNIEMPGEMVHNSTFIHNSASTACTHAGKVTGTISVPTNIVSGPTLCRIIALTNASTTATPITALTTTGNWGEVEDYIVTLKGQPDPNFSTHKWMTNKTGTTVLGTTNPIRLPSFDTTTLFIDTLDFVGCKLSITKSITVNPAPRGLRTFNATQCGPGIPPVSFRVRDSNAYTFPVIEWYAAAVGGSPLQQGIDTIYLNPINATTTLFVRIQNPTSGCWSTRSPITLTVTASDSIVGRGNGTRDTLRLCQGIPINLTTLNVQSGGATKSFDTFTWSGIVPGVSFPLKNTTGSQTINPSAGGNYRLFVDAIDTGTMCTARDTLNVLMQPNPFSGGQAFINAAPNPACVGTPITHTLRMANNLATMPNYTLGAALSSQTTGWAQIDTFQIDNFINSSASCAGLTPTAGPAANGLPASSLNAASPPGGRYSNYTSATAVSALTSARPVLIANTNVNFNVKIAFAGTSFTGTNAVSIFIDYNRASL